MSQAPLIASIDIPEGWKLLGAFAGAGLAGGLLKALTTLPGISLPHRKSTPDGPVLVPGFIGTAVVGAVAAGLSWALYGPLADALAIGSKTGAEEISYTASFAELAGAALVGYAGAQWIAAEADKRLAKAAAAAAAGARGSDELASEIRSATYEGALTKAMAAPRAQEEPSLR